MVAVMQSSHPAAIDENGDGVIVRGFQAPGRYLMDARS
jgi:hypothetical protein